LNISNPAAQETSPPFSCTALRPEDIFDLVLGEPQWKAAAAASCAYYRRTTIFQRRANMHLARKTFLRLRMVNVQRKSS
jgi:hypothetical protein